MWWKELCFETKIRSNYHHPTGIWATPWTTNGSLRLSRNAHCNKNAWFTVGTDSLPGDLTENVPTTNGFKTFIGCAYFSKHHSMFRGTQIPSSLYYSLQQSGTTEYGTPCKWLSNIREVIWQRIYFEDDLIPIIDALQSHCRHAVWVINYWRQSKSNVMDLSPLQNFWIHQDWEKGDARVRLRSKHPMHKGNFYLRVTVVRNHNASVNVLFIKVVPPCGPGYHFIIYCHNKETAMG